jgi:hypothetical protein
MIAAGGLALTSKRQCKYLGNLSAKPQTVKIEKSRQIPPPCQK